VRYRTNAIVVLLWHYLTLGISQRSFGRRYKMDSQDNNIDPETSKTLSSLLKENFKKLSPVEKAISTLIILLAFIGAPILLISKCSLSAFLGVMAVIILMAILINLIAYHFQQRREHDAQVIRIHKEVQSDLEELINVNSLKEILSIAKKVIERLTETVETTEQKIGLMEKLEKLDNYLKTLVTIREEFSIWEEAEIWLRNNQESLVKTAIGQFSVKHPDLKNPGRSLDSDEKTKGFEESINRHVQWALKVLGFGTVRIPLHESPVIPERYAYREIFEYLKNEVEKNKKPSAEAKEAIIGRLEFLINEYSD
jgi:hypothetical protein